jgi:hypothetical protein
MPLHLVVAEKLTTQRLITAVLAKERIAVDACPETIYGPMNLILV